jgi:TRAP-type C4-dicarboxylate transport system permease large subunit
MSAIGDTTSGLDIGRVIQQTFAVLGRNFLTFLILALLLTGLPTMLLGFLQDDTVRTAATAGSFNGVWTSAIGAIVTALTGLILQGTIIYGAVSDLNGKPASVVDSLRIGLYAFLPMLLLGIMMGVAIGAGFVLLIVPGIMLAVAWCVVIPAYVVERPNIMDAFGRSAQLTRGSRWSIFGLAVLYVIAVIIIEMVLLGVFGGLLRFAVTSGSVLAIRVVVLPLINVANALIGATGAAVLYVELRRIRDGVGPAGLAAIFD